MKSTTMDDYDQSIMVNFRHKRASSPDALEVAAYDKLVHFDDDSRTVESRERASSWLNNLYDTANESINNIFDIKSSSVDSHGRPVSTEEKNVLIEQERMRVLDSMGWVYRGSFHKNARNKVRDSKGEVKSVADAYPELSYIVTVKKVSGKLFYCASYGIMHGTSSAEYGSYSYFATLDESIEFINDQLILVGRKAYFKKINHTLALSYLRENKTNQNSEKAMQKALSATSTKAKDRVDYYVSKEVVENSIYNLRRSVDIFTLPDLIDRFLFGLADRFLSNAKELEYRQRQAELIADTEVVDLDVHEDQLELESGNSAHDHNEFMRKISMEAQQRSSQSSHHGHGPVRDGVQVDNHIVDSGSVFDLESDTTQVTNLDDADDTAVGSNSEARGAQWRGIIKDKFGRHGNDYSPSSNEEKSSSAETEGDPNPYVGDNDSVKESEQPHHVSPVVEENNNDTDVAEELSDAQPVASSIPAAFVASHIAGNDANDSDDNASAIEEKVEIDTAGAEVDDANDADSSESDTDNDVDVEETETERVEAEETENNDADSSESDTDNDVDVEETETETETERVEVEEPESNVSDDIDSDIDDVLGEYQSVDTDDEESEEESEEESDGELEDQDDTDYESIIMEFITQDVPELLDLDRMPVSNDRQSSLADDMDEFLN